MKKISDSSNQALKRNFCDLPLYPEKKPRINTLNTASIFIKSIGVPLICKYTRSESKSLHLEPYKPYTIGRDLSNCDFLFKDNRVSKTHCQILFDSASKKIYLSDGLFFNFVDCDNCSTPEVIRVSLNGVFVNEVRISKGDVVGLCVGDEVLLVCGDGSGVRIGFVVERIVLVEDIVDRSVHKYGESNVSVNCVIGRPKSEKFDAKAGFLLSMCREILCSNDPIKHIRKCSTISGKEMEAKSFRRKRMKKLFRMLTSNIDLTLRCEDHIHTREVSTNKDLAISQELVANSSKESAGASVRNIELKSLHGNGEIVEQVKSTYIQHENDVGENDKSEEGSIMKEDIALCRNNVQVQLNNNGGGIPSPGRKFYLNRLHFMDYGSLEHQNVVSLSELFHPVDSLIRVFIATFTSDIPWFLSYCKIPPRLPVTIACHNAERCWDSDPDKRTSTPYSDFPELVVVHPLFPEVIAFGKDRKKSGIACHHPKLFILQREDSLRVVITSANLGAKQWLHVSNTVWWQDFPRLSVPDYLSLFLQSSSGDNNENPKSDFAAQLAGFVASLVADVPCQAHWVLELSKYNFTGALVHLIASVPGIYSPQRPYMSDSKYFLAGNQCIPKPPLAKLLGSVEASVVGLSYLFRTSADSNGANLKKLATFLRKCSENVYGMSEILLRRETDVAADVNAVSVLLPKPEEFPVEDWVHLGFLPRNVAKWVAPLSDSGLFAFSAYVHPKEVLGAALEGNDNKVQLILYVSQGPSFSEISEVTRTEHVSAVCSLVASIQRCVGLWRLQEVLCHHNWPEHLESDFVFGSSSIGAINANFLAAFSAATGKRSVQLSESQESDPDWGCWSASQELRKPSIRIIYPTIERVKNASSGILASKYILCFSQKTWQRLKGVGILHDAIPHPNQRIGFPMHVKVACRRFQSKKDASSFGWVYCGSHNFSAAAWGRPLSNTLDKNAYGNMRSSSVLGSRLHICNYELGIIFTVPPPDSKGFENGKCGNLDDIPLPFVMPAPKYRPRDRPATPQAMREALAEVSKLKEIYAAESTGECPAEEVPGEEDEVLESADFVAQEKEDEKAYAEKLWIQVDSSDS